MSFQREFHLKSHKLVFKLSKGQSAFHAGDFASFHKLADATDTSSTEPSRGASLVSLEENTAVPHGDGAEQLGAGNRSHRGRRFVAGEAFFNYTTFGSLREGLPSVNLGSRSFCGLLVCAVVAGIATTFFQSVFRPLLIARFSVYHATQIVSAQYLMRWPGTLSLGIGLLSDCYPLFGFRRKSYILLGWLVALAMFVLLIVLLQTLDASQNWTGHVCLACSLVAALGVQIAWISTLAVSIEFAQRETLYERGHLQALFLACYFAARMVTAVVATHIVLYNDEEGFSSGLPDASRSHITMQQASALLAGVCVLPVLFVIYCLDEALATTSDGARHASSIRARGIELWNMMQCKVVYHTLFFVCGSVFLTQAVDTTAVLAVTQWSGITTSKTGNVTIASHAGRVVAALIWKGFLINFSWRRLAFIGFVAVCLGNAALTVPTVYGWVRSEWYAYFWVAFTCIPYGWVEMLVVMLPTEIANIGREGTVVGLVETCMVLITIATAELWESVSKGIGLDVSLEDIAHDTSSTRNHVFLASAVYFAINLLSIALVPFMPSQKLDAQQLRAFGGFNHTARVFLTVCLVVLFGYALVTNVLKILS